jgi:hypothetical protein
MKLRRRSAKYYHNGVRLPIILFLVIVGGLIGTRWMNEVRVQHLAQRLDRESRQLERDAVEIRGHIKDLEGQAYALLNRDSVNATLATKGVSMKEIPKGGALTFRVLPPVIKSIPRVAPPAAPSARNIAQTNIDSSPME